MKNDWTDLIREEILDIPSALSDDDWDSFQAKYAAARRRKKTAVTAWSGAVAAAAAVVIGVISADLTKDDTISVITPHVIEATAEGSAADIDMLVNKEKIDAAPEIHLPA